MNDPSTIPPTDEETPVSEACHLPSVTEIESLMRRHPFITAMASVGLGCAIGIAAREWLSPPPPPRNRALQLLEDIQSRLAELAEPAYDRAGDLADDGLNAVKRGLSAVGSSKIGSRLSHLFS